MHRGYLVPSCGKLYHAHLDDGAVFSPVGSSDFPDRSPRQSLSRKYQRFRRTTRARLSANHVTPTVTRKVTIFAEGAPFLAFCARSGAFRFLSNFRAHPSQLPAPSTSLKAGLVASWEGVSEKPHFSRRPREMGHPADIFTTCNRLCPERSRQLDRLREGLN